METSLHRELKEHYAGVDGVLECQVGRYRIDAVRDGVLYEIQHSGLGAIRRKVEALIRDHVVVVVKPIIARKRIVTRPRKGDEPKSKRWSPKRGSALDIFEELVHFVSLFPHKHLRLETPLVEIEEWRYPGSGRRRWKSKRDFVIEDQRMLSILETQTYRTATDLLNGCGTEVPREFDTEELANALSVKRRLAQKIAYCLSRAGATKACGKRGNSVVYRAA